MNKIWAIVAAIVIIIIGAYLIGSRQTEKHGYTVGMIAILSGEYASVGENFRNGTVLANEEYNKAHPNAPVKLVIEDDGFTGGKGVSAYQKLVTVDKIDALINVSTPTIDAIYDTVTKTSLPVIQGGEQGRAPTPDNIFGIFPDSIASEFDYGVYMRNKGVKNMSLVYTNLEAMIRFVDAFKKGFQGSTTDYIINTDEKDFRTHALKVAATNPANIGLFIFPQQGAQFLKEFAKVVKNKPQLFFDANFQSGYADYQRLLGDLKTLDGTLVGTIDTNPSDAFKQAYKTRFGTDAGFLTDMGYDAFNVLSAAYDKDPLVWQSNIKNISFDGIAGKIEFDANGNRKPKTKVMVIREGKISDLP